MLAKRYKRSKQIYPCYIQPKLNGFRGLWLGDRLQSRSYGRSEELCWQRQTLPNLFEELEKFPSHLFDGELYYHGWSLQRIASVSRPTSSVAHSLHSSLQYHIFDLISDEPYVRRLEKLQLLKDSGKIRPPLFLVDTYFCHDEAFGDKCYTQWKREGLEGAIYRDMNAHYGFEWNCPNQENRWNCLLKRKQRQDMECICIGVEESDKFLAIKEPHIKSLLLRTEKGIEFNCGGGLSHDEKVRFLTEVPENCVVRITYDSLSDAGVPLQPSIDCVYV